RGAAPRRPRRPCCARPGARCPAPGQGAAARRAAARPRRSAAAAAPTAARAAARARTTSGPAARRDRLASSSDQFWGDWPWERQAVSPQHGRVAPPREMRRGMREFPASPIAALVDETPRCNLAESYGSDLSVAELLGPDGSALLGSIKLGYRTSSGDPALRALVAGRTGVTPDQVLVTAGAAAALFMVAP